MIAYLSITKGVTSKKRYAKNEKRQRQYVRKTKGNICHVRASESVRGKRVKCKNSKKLVSTMIRYLQDDTINDKEIVKEKEFLDPY